MIAGISRGTALPDSPGIDANAGRTCLNSRRFSEKKRIPERRNKTGMRRKILLALMRVDFEKVR